MPTTFIDSPLSLRTRALRPFRFGLAWLARTMLLTIFLTGMQAAFAVNIPCSSASMASPFPGNRVLDSGTQVGRTFFNGNLVVTLTACNNNSSSVDSFTVAIPVDSVGVTLPAAAGINMLSTALPSYSIVSTTGGPCTFASSANSAGSTFVTFNQPGNSTCNYTVTFPVGLKMTSASNIAATGITRLSSAVDWWAAYGGSSGQSSNLQSSFDLISTACTLSTPDATVTLPTIAVGALSGGAGATAGRTPFTVALTGCSDVGASYAAKATWDFAQGPILASIANSAGTDKAASNVYVQLLDSGLIPIDKGGVSRVAQVSGGSATPAQHYAQYLAGNGSVGAGIVTGIATLNLSYE